MARKQQELQGVFVNQPNIQILYETLARVIGEQYGCEITVKVTPKEEN